MKAFIFLNSDRLVWALSVLGIWFVGKSNKHFEEFGSWLECSVNSLVDLFGDDFLLNWWVYSWRSEAFDFSKWHKLSNCILLNRQLDLFASNCYFEIVCTFSWQQLNAMSSWLMCRVECVMASNTTQHNISILITELTYQIKWSRIRA